jgi:hypothetical protein
MYEHDKAFFGLPNIMVVVKLGEWEYILCGARIWTSGCILATADTKVEINLCLWGLATKGLLTEANALTMEPLPPMQACMPLAICRRRF